VYGYVHPDVATSKFNLGLLLQNMGREVEGKEMFKEAATIFRSTLGAEHPHTKMTESAAE
jgi:hypothetical protein